LALVTGGAAIAERLLVRLIAASSSRVLVIAPYVDAQTPSMRPLTRALAKARDRGVTTHLLLGSEPSVAVRAELATLGIEMRAMDPLRATIGHAKGVVADGTA